MGPVGPPTWLVAERGVANIDTLPAPPSSAGHVKRMTLMTRSLTSRHILCHGADWSSQPAQPGQVSKNDKEVCLRPIGWNWLELAGALERVQRRIWMWDRAHARPAAPADRQPAPSPKRDQTKQILILFAAFVTTRTKRRTVFYLECQEILWKDIKYSL